MFLQRFKFALAVLLILGAVTNCKAQFPYSQPQPKTTPDHMQGFNENLFKGGSSGSLAGYMGPNNPATPIVVQPPVPKQTETTTPKQTEATTPGPQQQPDPPRDQTDNSKPRSREDRDINGVWPLATMFFAGIAFATTSIAVVLCLLLLKTKTTRTAKKKRPEQAGIGRVAVPECTREGMMSR